jgi:signal transduction histidine kinase
MRLRTKLLSVNLALLLSLVALAGTSLWGLLRQRAHVRASLAEYEALRLVESAEVRVIGAKAQLHDPEADRAAIAEAFKAALEDLRRYKAVLLSYDSFLPIEIPASQKTEAKLKTKTALAKLNDLVALADPPPAPGAPEPDPGKIAAGADGVTKELADLLHMCNGFLNQTGLASDADLRSATFAVTALAGAIPLLALLASLWQYGRIMVPLDRLRRWLRRAASGHLAEPYHASGDREFVELGDDVNKMAAELRAFYRQLEEMVAAKSKQLVRSERLASVGYLAAGVAHEINNPLGIMTGYAELSAKRLKRSSDPADIADVIQQLTIIREEAFRCKEITRKLLTLSKGGSDAREIVSLTQVASDVALMVRGLPNFRGRLLDVAINPTEPLSVEASPSEMKQVLLNLLVNALEAVKPGGGEVRVEGRRDGASVELSISDNGRGMNADTLERVFEPFYTDKRGVSEPGTGLGLSITHAIIEDHGGQIRATSAGIGLGSRFIVRLPAASEAPAPAALVSVDGSVRSAVLTTKPQRVSEG